MAPSRNPLVRLGHIRDEITELSQALEGITFSTFSERYVLRRTAEHAVLIISEAVKALPSALTDRYPAINWRAVRDVGNVLRHDYYEVDINVLWRIVTERLAELKPVIDAMIDEESGST